MKDCKVEMLDCYYAYKMEVFWSCRQAKLQNVVYMFCWLLQMMHVVHLNWYVFD